jgi:hypothetical protein
MRISTMLVVLGGLTAQISGQPGQTTRFAEAMFMPEDRAEDSYAIYSQLLKSGPLEWRAASRQQWLIEEITNATPLSTACQAPEGGPLRMNPHLAVEAPADRQAEWAEVLADYDRHCHDVVRLNRQNFKTELPVHLLNTEDRYRYMRNPNKPPAELAHGAGMHQFTEVFFNANHTLALVEEGMWCGSLCGNWMWVVLQRKQDGWEMLPWVRAAAFS